MDCVEKYNVTFLHASPTVYILLLDQKDKFKNINSIKKCAAGSANMPFTCNKEVKTMV